MKKIKVVLFDLDGTLLPMDLDVFMEHYLRSLTRKVAMHGYDPKTFSDAIMKGIVASLKNDGSDTNENTFWRVFSEACGEKTVEKHIFEEFYSNDFGKLRATCGYNPEARRAVMKIKEMGFRVALATNPAFPETATYQRMEWAGFSPWDFELVTTYENSSYCKPSPAYYTELTEKLSVAPDECLMVGNDTRDDLACLKCGIPVFLLTDCLINKNGTDVSRYPHGGFAELVEYVEKINK